MICEAHLLRHIISSCFPYQSLTYFVCILILKVVVRQDLSTVYLSKKKKSLNPVLQVMLLETQTCSIIKKLTNYFLKIISGAWIFTSALRVGITRHLVQAVRDHALASTSSKVRVITIGITSLRKIQHREILENTKVFFAYSTREMGLFRSTLHLYKFGSSRQNNVHLT